MNYQKPRRKTSQAAARRKTQRIIIWGGVSSGVLVLLSYYPHFFGDLFFILLMSIASLLLLALFVLLITSPIWIGVSAVRAGVGMVQGRKEEKAALDRMARQPETSLLRATEAPSSASDVLVRPSIASREDNPQQLLRPTEPSARPKDTEA